VGQVAHRAGLAAEARDQILAVGELGVEDLDRHHPVHRRLEGLVDRPHAARADLLQDLELAVQEISADVRVRRGHGGLGK
jgi:hypothetical protein